jgi:hypothetical protein
MSDALRATNGRRHPATGAAVLLQLPDWQTSGVVHARPSSHGVPFATGLPAHAPLWQASVSVHEF